MPLLFEVLFDCCLLYTLLSVCVQSCVDGVQYAMTTGDYEKVGSVHKQVPGPA